MLTGNTQFEHELKKRIAEEIARLVSDLATGLAIKDFPEYRFYVGQIQALGRVVQPDGYCDEVNTILSKR